MSYGVFMFVILVIMVSVLPLDYVTNKYEKQICKTCAKLVDFLNERIGV